MTDHTAKPTEAGDVTTLREAVEPLRSLYEAVATACGAGPAKYNRARHAFEEPAAELCRAALAAPPAPVVRVGKKAAGRLLDGIEHNELPGRRGVP